MDVMASGKVIFGIFTSLEQAQSAIAVTLYVELSLVMDAGIVTSAPGSINATFTLTSLGFSEIILYVTEYDPYVLLNVSPTAAWQYIAPQIIAAAKRNNFLFIIELF
jgi:hypothetical protein